MWKYGMDRGIILWRCTVDTVLHVEVYCGGITKILFLLYTQTTEMEFNH